MVRRQALGPRRAPRQRGPRCAKLRRARALTPNWPRPAPVGPVGAPSCAHGAACLRRASRHNNSPPGMAGLTCCTGGKSHPPKRATHPYQCKWQRLEEGNVLPVRRSGSVLAGGFSRSCQQLRLAPEPDTGCRTGTSCCCVAVFCCCTRPVNWGIRISNLSVLPGWSYGDSNPGPLACHQQAARPPVSVLAGHRPRACAPVRSGPHRLRYFHAGQIRSPARADRWGSKP
jgi:hypothetical protein